MGWNGITSTIANTNAAAMPAAVAASRARICTRSANAKAMKNAISTAACGLISSEYASTTHAAGIQRIATSGRSVLRSSRYTASNAKPPATESTWPQ